MTTTAAAETAALRRNRRLLSLLQRTSPALAARVGMALFLHPQRKPLRPRDQPTLARARRGALHCHGHRIQLYQWDGEGRHAVLVHGWGSAAPRFASMVEALLATGWRVSAFDAPAHGQSGGWLSGLPAFQDALLATLAAHGPADLLVGHSLGALAIALALGEGRIAPRPRAAAWIGMPAGVPFLVERYRQMFPAGPAMERHFMRLFLKRFGQPPAHFTVQRVATRLQLPVLLLHDTQDAVVPCDHSTRLAGLLPRATLHLTHGLGHSELLDDGPTLGLLTAFAQEACSP